MTALLFFALSFFSLGIIWLEIDECRDRVLARRERAAELASWEAPQ